MTVDSFYYPIAFANDGGTEYTFELESIGEDAIQLYKNDGTTRTLLTPTYHYHIDFEEHLDPIFTRGTITLAAPIAPGAWLEVLRYTPRTTLYEATAQEPFLVEQFEYALDKICFIQQELEGHLCGCPPYTNYPEYGNCPDYACDAYEKQILLVADAYWPLNDAPVPFTTYPNPLVDNLNSFDLTYINLGGGDVAAQQPSLIDDCAGYSLYVDKGVDSTLYWYTTDTAIIPYNSSATKTLQFVFSAIVDCNPAIDHGMLVAIRYDAPSNNNIGFYPHIAFNANGTVTVVYGHQNFDGSGSTFPVSITTTAAAAMDSVPKAIGIVYNQNGSGSCDIYVNWELLESLPLLNYCPIWGSAGNQPAEMRFTSLGASTYQGHLQHQFFLKDAVLSAADIAALKLAWDRNVTGYVDPTCEDRTNPQPAPTIPDEAPDYNG